MRIGFPSRSSLEHEGHTWHGTSLAKRRYMRALCRARSSRIRFDVTEAPGTGLPVVARYAALARTDVSDARSLFSETSSASRFIRARRRDAAFDQLLQRRERPRALVQSRFRLRRPLRGLLSLAGKRLPDFLSVGGFAGDAPLEQKGAVRRLFSFSHGWQK